MIASYNNIAPLDANPALAEEPSSFRKLFNMIPLGAIYSKEKKRKKPEQ